MYVHVCVVDTEQNCRLVLKTGTRPNGQVPRLTRHLSRTKPMTERRRMGQLSSPLSKFKSPKRLVLYLERPLAARNSSSGCPSLSTSTSLAASASGSGTVRVAAAGAAPPIFFHAAIASSES